MHKKPTVYLNHPRLFEGDGQMSALRGRLAVPNIDEYLKRKDHVVFVVKKWVDCDEHVDAIQKSFHPLPMSNDPEIPASVPPYFSILQNHSPLADIVSETMELISETLRQTVVKVTGMNSDDIAPHGIVRNLDTMRDRLYYISREEDYLNMPTPAQLLHLNVLLEYMESQNRAEYEKVDRLISQGLITEKYLPRLYGPEQILMTSVDGHVRGYMLESAPINRLSVSLELWSWRFNGMFFKQRETRSLSWPSAVPAD
ncbi:hypothetical protein BO99DRAFT_428360 [Aspergillus violaceofuscus CBS 115571]|uniref:Uncharacterized protein n=1 Tax=Aspergillus violaceofuscus (strain CBS 115571) TaxID=1450538 RepID=A0A2V5HI34_ASPV1|nr:hypothetical protein BO99DRAFT_428360 [Aspergillus violaceofuscus CBS 115571]